MEALIFQLKGQHGFFKMPDVNAHYYFTYGNIHKVALLGIFGAILGYRGYESPYGDFPEFYEKLRCLQVSVVPKGPRGGFAKKIQAFNNSVGYASQEQGGNLVVKEEWLERPEWTVYVLLEEEEGRKLAEAVLQNRCVYMPYLGKNDHPADLDSARISPAVEVEPKESYIDSLFPASAVVLDEEDGFNFKYEEDLPIGLEKETNQYRTAKMNFTDERVASACTKVYRIEDKNIVFY